MARVGRLEVSALCLGGNVFGWTLDESEGFAILDAYLDAGENFIDTADSYPPRASGLPPGASEAIIGSWMAARGVRDDIVVATKVGNREGLSPARVRAGAEASLRRLRTDHIDLYYAHRDDPDTPLEETLGAFDALVRDGLVREVGLSNYSAERLEQALAIVEREGYAPIAALQPHYNLVERAYEHEQGPICLREGIACVPYAGLASGFLSGKYRAGHTVDSVRASRASAYLEHARALRALEALDVIARPPDATVAAVALTWLAEQPSVVAPIASARTLEQLEELLRFKELTLTAVQLDLLDSAS
ncbi:MAG TPA: aldo/keto reductase [Solirubrobacteraceae bacterium]|nr:aldo/keto reductase [Solirubrobacteraceae bacterium]